MEKIIERLDEWLKRNRPAYHGKLLPGATDEELGQLEQATGLKLPESFKSLYRWRNGQPPDVYEPFHDNKMLLSLREIQERWVMLKGLLEGGDFEVENWWRTGWVPFLHDGGGNYLCLDLEGTFTGHGGQLLEFWHDESDRDVLFPDFEGYLQTLVDCLEGREWGEDEEYWELGKECIASHHPGYPKPVTVE